MRKSKIPEAPPLPKQEKPDITCEECLGWQLNSQTDRDYCKYVDHDLIFNGTFRAPSWCPKRINSPDNMLQIQILFDELHQMQQLHQSLGKRISALKVKIQHLPAHYIYTKIKELEENMRELSKDREDQ